MANLSSLVPATTAITALSNLVLVTPQSNQGYQPQNPIPMASQQPQQQPPAFLFDIEADQTLTLKSDITDYFVEDNSPIEDHIALRPVTITTHGFVGELNNVAPSLLLEVHEVADKLLTVAAYTPNLTLTALEAYNQAFFLYQVGANAVNSAVAAISSLVGVSGQTIINGQGIAIGASQNKQQTAFQLFYGYWLSRTLFTVQTPWAVFRDMAIETVIPTQDASTRMISEFAVTFKMIRYTSTALYTPQVQGRLGSQSAGITDLGTQVTRPGPSLNTQLSSSFPVLS